MPGTSGKTLVIAEKPSVAQDLASSLPDNFKKEKTHFEGEKYVISYAIGHLVTLCNPKEMDDRHKEWSLSNLPIIPEVFPLKALPKTRGQLSALGKLIKRKDIQSIINACDAGREGELIFRYILAYATKDKPLKKELRRLWLQSMTRNAILEGFERLRSDEDMANLAAAAASRSEADWLVGINGSRALTSYKSKFGGFFLTPCGRVQTPTLSILVQREKERKEFQPQDYWEVHALFQPDTGNGYPGRWFDPGFKKDETRPHGRAERIWTEADAKSILDKCLGKPAKVQEEQKPSSQGAPQLYDLTSLQREANGRFGFSAKHTLSLVQSLYERHKCVTYPRTDSRYLPQDYIPTVKDAMKGQVKGDFGKYAKQALDEGLVRPNRRIFDDKKVSDHHAIIPTHVTPKGLPEAEAKIYQMIVQRFLAAFFPAAEYLITTRISIVEDEHFKTEGKVLKVPGWRAIYGINPKEEALLEPLSATGKTTLKEAEIKADQTRPPARFTESTLLSFMEGAGKYVEDEELAEALKERGLGTPATRAAIIEGLIQDNYVARDAKELVPTAKAFDLMGMLEAMDIEALVKPELTGEWEFKLNRIEKGLITREEFMKEIETLTRSIVEKIKQFQPETLKQVAPFSPLEGKIWYEYYDKYESEDGKLAIRKVLGGRQMDPEDIVELVKNRTIGPMDGFRSKKGRPFTAVIRINDESKVEFVFEDDTAGPDGQPLDTSKQESVGRSPVDGSEVYETLTAYVSKSALDGDEEKGLKVTKVILGKEISRENIARMLAGEKTELIKGFQSSRTRRYFDAYLKLSPKGKMEFEFPESPGRRRWNKRPAAQKEKS